MSSSMWRREWPAFSGWEAAGTLVTGAGTAALFLLKPPADPRWRGGILFDDAARDGLRLRSADARLSARSVGDMAYYASPLLPVLVDPLLVAWLVRDDSRVALNLELVAVEAFSYAGFLSFVSTRLSVRERPDATECRRRHPDGAGCAADTESFWSGHTSIAAASAGLVCASHRYMPLWGHPLADASACALAAGGALLTGGTRLLADRHYLTDVLVGWGVGFGFGYGVPTLLHFTRQRSDISLMVVPGACTGGCLTLTGSF
jgi:membrane-associated phospholipid phosphatase